jgi:hypothetical protein
MTAMKRAKTTPKKETEGKPDLRCRDCAHAYDWHSPAIDGHMILCRCPLDKDTEYGKWSRFLTDPACEQFKQRQ